MSTLKNKPPFRPPPAYFDEACSQLGPEKTVSTGLKQTKGNKLQKKDFTNEIETRKSGNRQVSF